MIKGDWALVRPLIGVRVTVRVREGETNEQFVWLVGRIEIKIKLFIKNIPARRRLHGQSCWTLWTVAEVAVWVLWICLGTLEVLPQGGWQKLKEKLELVEAPGPEPGPKPELVCHLSGRQITDIITSLWISCHLNCFETFERTNHLVQEVHQAPPEACSAGPGVLEGPWTDGARSDETICGPASLAWCHRHFPDTKQYEHFSDVMAWGLSEVGTEYLRHNWCYFRAVLLSKTSNVSF